MNKTADVAEDDVGLTASVVDDNNSTDCRMHSSIQNCKKVCLHRCANIHRSLIHGNHIVVGVVVAVAVAAADGLSVRPHQPQ